MQKYETMYGWVRHMTARPFDFIDLLEQVDKETFKIRYPSLRVPKFKTVKMDEHVLVRFNVSITRDGTLVVAGIYQLWGRVPPELKIKVLDLRGLPAAPIIGALKVISAGQIRPAEVKIASTWRSQVEAELKALGIQLILDPQG